MCAHALSAILVVTMRQPFLPIPSMLSPMILCRRPTRGLINHLTSPLVSQARNVPLQAPDSIANSFSRARMLW